MPFNVTVEAENILKTFGWCFSVYNCSKAGTPTCEKVIQNSCYKFNELYKLT